MRGTTRSARLILSDRRTSGTAQPSVRLAKLEHVKRPAPHLLQAHVLHPRRHLVHGGYDASKPSPRKGSASALPMNRCAGSPWRRRFWRQRRSCPQERSSPK